MALSRKGSVNSGMSGGDLDGVLNCVTFWPRLVSVVKLTEGNAALIDTASIVKELQETLSHLTPTLPDLPRQTQAKKPAQPSRPAPTSKPAPKAPSRTAGTLVVKPARPAGSKAVRSRPGKEAGGKPAPRSNAKSDAKPGFKGKAGKPRGKAGKPGAKGGSQPPRRKG